MMATSVMILQIGILGDATAARFTLIEVSNVSSLACMRNGPLYRIPRYYHFCSL